MQATNVDLIIDIIFILYYVQKRYNVLTDSWFGFILSRDGVLARYVLLIWLWCYLRLQGAI